MVTPERGWAQRETDGWVASGSPLPEAAWNNLKTGDAAEMQVERRKRNLMPRGPDFLCWEMRLLTAGGWLGSELQAPAPGPLVLKPVPRSTAQRPDCFVPEGLASAPL